MSGVQNAEYVFLKSTGKLTRWMPVCCERKGEGLFLSHVHPLIESFLCLTIWEKSLLFKHTQPGTGHPTTGMVCVNTIKATHFYVLHVKNNPLLRIFSPFESCCPFFTTPLALCTIYSRRCQKYHSKGLYITRVWVCVFSSYLLRRQPPIRRDGQKTDLLYFLIFNPSWLCGDAFWLGTPCVASQ